MTRKRHNRIYTFRDPRLITLNATGEDPLVFFGTSSDITRFMANDTHLDERLNTNNILLIPIDGELPLGNIDLIITHYHYISLFRYSRRCLRDSATSLERKSV